MSIGGMAVSAQSIVQQDRDVSISAGGHQVVAHHVIGNLALTHRSFARCLELGHRLACVSSLTEHDGAVGESLLPGKAPRQKWFTSACEDGLTYRYPRECYDGHWALDVGLSTDRTSV